jgi:hypothetical protein
VFIAVELAFLAAAHAWGGPPWVIVGVLVFAAQIVAGMRLESLPMLVAALGWLAAFHVTGDREYFFPYCMHLASQACVCLAGRGGRVAAAAGGLVVAAFLAIRVVQGAGGRVLAVETAVAGVVMAAVIAAVVRLPRRPAADAAIVVAAAIVACAGLAL